MGLSLHRRIRGRFSKSHEIYLGQHYSIFDKCISESHIRRTLRFQAGKAKHLSQN